MRLEKYDKNSFTRGRSRWVEGLWIILSALAVSSFMPGTKMRVFLLRLFGAKIGHNVTLKPYVKIKFPWNLEVHDNVWIGEGVWIDNLAKVRIGSNSCVSQGAYLCTGSHNWSRRNFDLILDEINIADQCWIGAMARVAPGTYVNQGAVLTMGSSCSGTLSAWTIYKGNPAQRDRSRMEVVRD